MQAAAPAVGLTIGCATGPARKWEIFVRQKWVSFSRRQRLTPRADGVGCARNQLEVLELRGRRERGNEWYPRHRKQTGCNHLGGHFSRCQRRPRDPVTKESVKVLTTVAAKHVGPTGGYGRGLAALNKPDCPLADHILLSRLPRPWARFGQPVEYSQATGKGRA